MIGNELVLNGVWRQKGRNIGPKTLENRRFSANPRAASISRRAFGRRPGPFRSTDLFAQEFEDRAYRVLILCVAEAAMRTVFQTHQPISRLESGM
jgi:hypothetical protein